MAYEGCSGGTLMLTLTSTGVGQGRSSSGRVSGSPGEGASTVRSSCTWTSIRARCAAGCQISSKGPATDPPARRPRSRVVSQANPPMIAPKTITTAMAGSR